MNNQSKERLDALRIQLTASGLDGFIIPRVSEYQGEFVADYAERLAWLTGFTGSAGTAVVLRDKAAIFTDGRYTIQLAQQADKNLYEFENSQRLAPSKWLQENAEPHQIVGYDPWLITVKQFQQMGKTLFDKRITLVPVQENPVDTIWFDRPEFPREKAEIFPDSFAGLTSDEKIKDISRILKDKGFSACVINMPDSMAWLLNVRGHDVKNTPVVLSFGILHADGRVQWFVAKDKITEEVKKHIGPKIEIALPDKIGDYLHALNGKVGLDFSRAPVWFKQTLGEKAEDFKDPCIDAKAIKNSAEQESLRQAHIRDGAALVNFLYWFEKNADGLTELDVVAKLEEFRRRDNTYRGPSFDTIAGWGPNGAVVHYRATEETNAKIHSPGLLLLDSGGQYNDGTTDITRTIAVGTPTEEMRTNFTLVLKGHINVAKAKFPEGASGAQIDALARAPLWNAGLDYAHGTGHGVGCYLSVHEESASISPRGTEPLKAGMFLSNEPGFYKEGEYGIRTENLVLVREVGKNGEGQKILGFETFSLAPIDRRLIKKEMLTADELEWLNAYHAKVLKTLGPRLGEEVTAWLANQAAVL